MKKITLLLVAVLAISFAGAQNELRGPQPVEKKMLSIKEQKETNAKALEAMKEASEGKQLKRQEAGMRTKMNRTMPLFTPVSPKSLNGLSNRVYTYNEADNHYTGHLDTPGTMTALSIAYPYAIQCGEYVAGVQYIIDYSNTGGNRFGFVNTITGAFTPITTSAPDAWGMAWNPVTDRTYVTTWSESSNSALYEINLSTGQSALIGEVGRNVTIAIDNEGVCYAVATGTDSSFGKMDLSTGAYTEICKLGFTVSYVQNLSIDRSTDELYWSARESNNTTGSDGLYRVNKTTGELTLIGTFTSGFNCASFTILSDYVSNKNIPASPENLTAIPDDQGSLSCKLTWTNPSETIGGSVLTALTRCVLTRDEVVVTTFENPVPGAVETYIDVSPTVGLHAYAVYAVNDEGMGVRTFVEAFVGKDVELLAIERPFSGPNLTASEVVRISIKNNGAYAVSDVPVAFTLNGGVPVTETIGMTISARSEYTYTFTATADLSAVQVHTLTVSVSLVGDGIPENNTQVLSVENYGNVALMGYVPEIVTCDIRFVDDGADNDYVATAKEQIITFFPATAGNMVSITFNDLATAIDPYFGSYDALYVINGVFSLDDISKISDEDILGAFAGDYADNLPETIVADNKEGALTVFFSKGNYLGIVERGWEADIACVAPPEVDVAVTALDVPEPGVLTTSELITITVLNKGSQILSDIPVVCEVNGVALPGAVVAGPLGVYEVGTHDFIVDLSVLGDYEIKVYANMPGDESRANDTIIAHTVCLPPVAVAWDFEEGMPDDFTLYLLDEGVANAVNIFPDNEAWAVWEGDSRLSPIDSLCAVSQSWFSSGTGDANRWMVTPQITLGETAMLQWDARCYESVYPDGYDVRVSIAGIAEMDFTTALFTIEAENGSWINRTVDLSAYAGQKVYIAFIQNSSDQNMIAIDNIRLLGNATTGTESGRGVVVSGSEVNIYPNPTADKIHMNVADGVVSWRLFTLEAVLIQQSETPEADLSALANGIYLIEVNGVMHKVVKK